MHSIIIPLFDYLISIFETPQFFVLVNNVNVIITNKTKTISSNDGLGDYDTRRDTT